MGAGTLIWITGLAGSGKTTIAREVYAELTQKYPNTVHLDGDSMRDMLKNEYAHKYGHTIEDRKATAHIYVKLASLLTSQGINVVVSTISLFHEIHEANRINNERYIEVLINTDQEELVRRTSKKTENLNQHQIYAQTQNVMGMHQQPEFPKEPTLVVINNDEEHIKENANKILTLVNQWQL